jgi:hypothetical protein
MTAQAHVARRRGGLHEARGVGLQGVNGLGELTGAPGAGAELAENPPVLELGVRPFAGCAELRVSAVGLFL